MLVDLIFPVRGRDVPLDHGYALFGAVSRLVPALHAAPTWGIHPILGQRLAPGVLGLFSASRLGIRLPATDIHHVLVLAGKQLDLDGHPIVVGAPSVVSLREAKCLHSRFVTFKGGNASSEAFLAMSTRALEKLAQGCPELQQAQLKVGERRVMRVATHTIVGFAAEIHGLLPNASVHLQECGLGGRRHMGAGVLIPAAKAN